MEGDNFPQMPSRGGEGDGVKDESTSGMLRDLAVGSSGRKGKGGGQQGADAQAAQMMQQGVEMITSAAQLVPELRGVC